MSSLFLPMTETVPVIPQHVAIIMDGNGRWAVRQGLPAIAGHEAGACRVREIAKKAQEMGVRYLTLYTFSTENWRRPQAWVDDLIGLLQRYLSSNIGDEFIEAGIRFRVIGDTSKFSRVIQKMIVSLEKKTKDNTGLTLILALNYGARTEITQAARSIARAAQEGTLSVDAITNDVFSQHLCTADFPDPDLLIRTSGEQRISNFLLWQLAYAELVFTPKLWPDFGGLDFEHAISLFQGRERRYGETIGS